MLLKYTPERNPVISLLEDGVVFHKILSIGDPHLGRSFKTGVPSHRVGDREKIVLTNFFMLLNPTDPLIKDIVIMGDLFDKFVVSPTVVLQAYNLIIDALLKNKKTRYTLIPGNHDLSKDKSKKSSYELLAHLLINAHGTNHRLKVLLNQPSYFYVLDSKQGIHTILNFDCYCPFEEERWSFSDQRGANWDEAEQVISFGHWDSLDIIQQGYTPSQELLDGSTLVVSGHEHSPKLYNYPFDKNKTPVLFTGSMQPYSHAEDPLKEIYLTIPSEKLGEYSEEDLKFKCVRIYCDNTFALEENIDCLALSYLYKDKEVEEKTEEELLTLDASYTKQLTTFMSSLETDCGYEKELLQIFKDKSFSNASN